MERSYQIDLCWQACFQATFRFHGLIVYSGKAWSEGFVTVLLCSCQISPWLDWTCTLLSECTGEDLRTANLQIVVRLCSQRRAKIDLPGLYNEPASVTVHRADMSWASPSQQSWVDLQYPPWRVAKLPVLPWSLRATKHHNLSLSARSCNLRAWNHLLALHSAYRTLSPHCRSPAINSKPLEVKTFIVDSSRLFSAIWHECPDIMNSASEWHNTPDKPDPTTS